MHVHPKLPNYSFPSFFSQLPTTISHSLSLITAFSWFYFLLSGQQSKGSVNYHLHACVLSSVSGVWLFATLRSVACQAPLSMGFSRQEYWSDLPCPPPGDLPDPGIKLHLSHLLHWQVGSLPWVQPEKPHELSFR